MKIINKEKFLEAFNVWKSYKENQPNYQLDEDREKLVKTIIDVEFALRQSNRNFIDSLAAKWEDAFEEIISELSAEEVESKAKELSKSLFAFYYLSLPRETDDLSKQELGEIISILKVFQKEDNHFLKTIYQENQEKIDDTIETFESLELSLKDYKEEPVAINQSWQNIHSSFTPQLIQSWQNHNFTYEQTRDWINIHAPNQQIQAIQEPEFYAYLQNELQLTSVQVLNDNSVSLSELKEHFREYQQEQQQTQVVQLAYGIPSYNNIKKL